MKFELDLFDPTGVRICTSQIETPITVYSGEGEPMSQNYYVLHIGEKKVKICKDGSVDLEI